MGKYSGSEVCEAEGYFHSSKTAKFRNPIKGESACHFSTEESGDCWVQGQLGYTEFKASCWVLAKSLSDCKQCNVTKKINKKQGKFQLPGIFSLESYQVIIKKICMQIENNNSQ